MDALPRSRKRKRIFASLFAAAEHLMQLVGEGGGMGTVATVIPGEAHRYCSKPLSQGERGAMGQLSLRSLSDAHHDPCRSRSQGGDIGDVEDVEA